MSNEALMQQIKLVRAEQRQGHMVLFTIIAKSGNPDASNEDIEAFVLDMMDAVEANAREQVFGVDG